MNRNDSRTRSWRLYLEVILCQEKSCMHRRNIQDNHDNNRFSTLERASEIEVPFIRKRVRSSELLQFNENSYKS